MEEILPKLEELRKIVDKKATITKRHIDTGYKNYYTPFYKEKGNLDFYKRREHKKTKKIVKGEEDLSKTEKLRNEI